MKWIKADKDPSTGLMTFAIDGKMVVSYQELDGEHYLILAERPSEKYPSKMAAISRVFAILREGGGDVDRLHELDV